MSRLLKKVQDDIGGRVSKGVECREWRSSIVLEGRVRDWGQVVSAGKIAANRGYKGVVNRLEAEGVAIPGIKKPGLADEFLEGRRVDVLVIGGGVIGCAIARELSRHDISVLLLDKEEDVAMHTSSRNDGMVHPGIDLKPGTKKALYCIRGNSLYTRAAEELDVRFRRPGTLILLEDSWMRLLYPLMKRRARLNGIEGIRYLSNEELKKAEPYLSGGFFGAVLLPTAGIISPYRLTVAYAENAVQNGAEISLNTIALSMELEKDSIVSVRTNRGTVYPSIVINAAGAYADSIADMAGDQFFTIHPRKGEVAFLDEKKGRYLNSVLGRMDIHTSSSNTKGGGLVKTIDGNVLVGPDAYEQPFREDYSTNSDNITKVLKKHLPLMPIFSPSDVIAYCAGIRAATYEEDFIVEKSEYVKNLVHAAGIQSPGLASAPAIAEEIESIAVKLLCRIKEIKPREGWNPRRKGIPDLKNMGLQEKNALISKRPDYGTIVCRCEGVSRGEIVDAINSPIPVRTVDGIKRRVKPGMGRCQGGFCMPLVMSILAEEGKTNMLSITKKGGKSRILAEETKTHIGGGGDEHGNV